MLVSVVIPTRNRPESLKRVLDCIGKQQLLPDEVTVVDSSDERERVEELCKSLPDLKIRLINSVASVCIQRNIGISESGGKYIFLCDDDIEIEPDYLKVLITFLKEHSDEGAVSGVICQKDKEGKWVYEYPPNSVSSLYHTYLFGLPVWGSLPESFKKSINPLTRHILNFYNRKGNTVTKGGWPLITQFSNPIFKTKIYGLGGAIVRRDWLLSSRYDENLDQHGIGDNYGVCMGFPGSINVSISARLYHHMEPKNRIESTRAFYLRNLALHYFILTSVKSRKMAVFFVWSLAGFFTKSILSADFRKARVTLKVGIAVITGSNPYLKKRLSVKGS